LSKVGTQGFEVRQTKSNEKKKVKKRTPTGHCPQTRGAGKIDAPSPLSENTSDYLEGPAILSGKSLFQKGAINCRKEKGIESIGETEKLKCHGIID